jgi:hypothetical protein
MVVLVLEEKVLQVVAVVVAEAQAEHKDLTVMAQTT